MDTNTAINNIKKITRRVESGEFDRYYVSTSLSNIRHMLYSLGLCNEASSVQEVCYELAGSKYSVKSINSRLSHIMAILRKIKGKTVAKESGRATSRKKGYDKGSKHKDYVPAKRLSLYDVVLAPIHGGYHYSIVARIQHNDSVVCYPMISGNCQDLETLGCKAVQLTGSCNGRFKDAFITSSCTTIPYQAALNCYVGKFDNVSDVRNAINSFKKNVI